MRELLIEMGNSHSRLVNCNDGALVSEVSHKCSFLVQGAWFSDAYRSKRWDGRKRLFNDRNQRFPTGLVGIVFGVAQEQGYTVQLNDIRIKPKPSFDVKFSPPFPLRDYQMDAVKKSEKAQRGVLKMATGSGKTLTALALIDRLRVKALFIVNTKEALYDTYDMAQKCFPDEGIGIYGDGKKIFGRFITVATMSSIAARVRKKDPVFEEENYQCLVVDEIHHSGSQTWYDIIMRIDSYYKYGLTGTAFRADGSTLFLRATSGRRIVDIPARKLIDAGFLVEPEVVFLDVPFAGFDYPMPYTDIYEGGIIRNESRNREAVRIVKNNPGKSKLVIFERLVHGDILYAMIKKVDPGAVLITGKTKDRKKLKEMFTNGLIKTVVASRIYNESADMPILEIVVNLAGGKSGLQVLQRIGRSLRLNPGKARARIFDFSDSFNYKLEQHAARRMSWVKKERFILKEEAGAKLAS